MPAIDVSRYEMIKITKDDGIATLTLTNPGKKNAVNRKMHHELGLVWNDVDDDNDIRVVILTGHVDAFCSGADLTASDGVKDHGERNAPIPREPRRIFWSMLDCGKPIISKVRGPAYGLGVNVALSADIVVAAQTARFCDSHAKIGIAPGDGGTALWPLLIGFHRAKELLMLAEPVPAEKAAQIGLINHCVPDAELDAFVQALAQRLRDSAPLAITYAKLSVNTMLKQMMAGSFETSLAYDLLTIRTNDVREGAAAFAQKRKPNFTGS